jgi:hypothetical protein
VHLLVSLKRPTRYASKASWRARRAMLCICKSDFMSQAISRTTDKTLEGCLPQQKVRVLLVFTDLTKGNSPRGPTMGFLQAPSPSELLCSLCCKLSVWDLSPSWPVCGLLRSGHCPIVDVVFLFVFLCVCFAVRCSAQEKKEESVMSPNFNNENLNHPFTGTSLHMVASKSMPERIEVSCQIGIHSITSVLWVHFLSR